MCQTNVEQNKKEIVSANNGEPHKSTSVGILLKL
jgi:hypothetical protein